MPIPARVPMIINENDDNDINDINDINEYQLTSPRYDIERCQSNTDDIMAVPWIHWSPAPPAATQTTTPSTDESAAQLREIVKAYVERASNNENRYAEPIELETITTYAAHPDLLSVILAVLTDRLEQGYPYTLKSLDILLHLLHAKKLPHPAFYPPCRALYEPIIALATPSHSHSAGKGPGPGDAYVKAKADEFLVGVGYDVRVSDAWVGGRGVGGAGLWCTSPWMGGDGGRGDGGGVSGGGSSFGWTQVAESAWMPRSVGAAVQTYPWITTTTTTASFPHISAEGLTRMAHTADHLDTHHASHLANLQQHPGWASITPNVRTQLQQVGESGGKWWCCGSS